MAFTDPAADWRAYKETNEEVISSPKDFFPDFISCIIQSQANGPVTG